MALSKSPLFSILCLILYVGLSVDAKLFVTVDKGGLSCQGGSTCSFSWIDDLTPPSLSDMGECLVGLYHGQMQLVQSIPNVDVLATNTLSFRTDPSAGPNFDQYYVAFTSISGKDIGGQFFTGFTPSINMNGMTGSTFADKQSPSGSPSQPGQQPNPVGQTNQTNQPAQSGVPGQSILPVNPTQAGNNPNSSPNAPSPTQAGNNPNMSLPPQNTGTDGHTGPNPSLSGPAALSSGSPYQLSGSPFPNSGSVDPLSATPNGSLPLKSISAVTPSAFKSKYSADASPSLSNTASDSAVAAVASSTNNPLTSGSVERFPASAAAFVFTIVALVATVF